MTETRTPLGQAVEAARKQRRLSVREASDRAGISEGRWRQLVKGYQSAGGHQVPAHPRDTTVMGMARAVGLDVNEALALAGLAPLEVPEVTLTDSDGSLDLAELLAADDSLDDQARDHIVSQYRMLQELSRHRSGTPPDKGVRSDARLRVRREYPSDRQEGATGSHRP